MNTGSRTCEIPENEINENHNQREEVPLFAEPEGQGES